jgi:hypothetical protein
LDHVKSNIEISYPKSFYMVCKPTPEELAQKLKAPASYQIRTNWNISDMGAAPSKGSASSTPSEETAESESESEEEATGPINPDGTQNRLVRRRGESQAAFLLRKKAALRSRVKIAPAGSTDSSFTEEDAKEYTDGKKGHWMTGTFKATAWCSDKMALTTGYVDACVVDEKGEGAFKGTFLEIRNSSSDYPVYYGLSGVINKKVEPGEKETEDLHSYVAIDPSKRAQQPDTVVSIVVKYWKEDR